MVIEVRRNAAQVALDEVPDAPDQLARAGTPEMAEWVVDIASHRIVRRVVSDTRRPNHQ